MGYPVHYRKRTTEYRIEGHTLEETRRTIAVHYKGQALFSYTEYWS